MQLYDIDHVYKCQVPGYEGTGLFLNMKVVPSKEFDAAVNEAIGLTPEMVSEKTNKLIKSKIVSVEGYPGVETADDLYLKGHPDIWDFAKKAVFKARMLGAAELKNS